MSQFNMPYKSILIFLFVVIISIFFGCGGQKKPEEKKETIFPSEQFSVIQFKLTNGKPVIGSINMAYKNYNLKSDYPWCLKIGIALDLDSVYANGLPLQQESEIANSEEDSLISKIRKLSTVHYVGHLFNDTFLDIYLYLPDPKPIHAYLQATKDDKIWKRGFGWQITEDPKWDSVTKFMK